MQFVLFSDLHLDSQFGWLDAAPQAARNRRQALRQTLLNIVQLARDVEAEALLCGGDLYEHQRVSPDTAQFLRSTFADLDPVRVFIAPGNHDWYGPKSLYKQVGWSSNVHVFNTPRLESVLLADGLILWGAAHCAPANTPGFLDTFEAKGDALHLALFHGSERGWFSEQEEGKEPHAPFSEKQIEETGLHHVFLGHYHRPRQADRHTYPGNPDPLNFGEDGLRGAVVVTVAPDGTVSRQWCQVSVTEMHDIEIDISGCNHQQDIRDRLQYSLASLRGFVRVTVFGELSPEVELQLIDLAQKPSHLDGLQVRSGSIRHSYDLDALKEEQTVRGEFVRDILQDRELSEEQRRKVLLTGLRALDGRSDLEVM